jgi:hypothetical protein
MVNRSHSVTTPDIGKSDSLSRQPRREFRAQGTVPFAGAVSDPCDGRTQGTHGMFDSLPYRNDAAIVLRRLIRSLPLRRGVLGIATCDKGLPAMMMALAGARDLPSVIVPAESRCLPLVEKMPGKSRQSARASPMDSSHSRRQPTSVAAPAPRPAVVVSSSARPPLLKSSPRHSAWPFPTPRSHRADSRLARSRCAVRPRCHGLAKGKRA